MNKAKLNSVYYTSGPWKSGIQILSGYFAATTSVDIWQIISHSNSSVSTNTQRTSTKHAWSHFALCLWQPWWTSNFSAYMVDWVQNCIHSTICVMYVQFQMPQKLCWWRLDWSIPRTANSRSDVRYTVGGSIGRIWAGEDIRVLCTQPCSGMLILLLV